MNMILEVITLRNWYRQQSSLTFQFQWIDRYQLEPYNLVADWKLKNFSIAHEGKKTNITAHHVI